MKSPHLTLYLFLTGMGGLQNFRIQGVPPPSSNHPRPSGTDFRNRGSAPVSRRFWSGDNSQVLQTVTPHQPSQHPRSYPLNLCQCNLPNTPWKTVTTFWNQVLSPGPLPPVHWAVAVFPEGARESAWLRTHVFLVGPMMQ